MKTMDRSIWKGFTLIEMMIAVTVLTVIASISFVGVVTFNQMQGIEDDAKLLVSEIRLAYSRATGIFYPPGCNGRVTGYRMTFTNGENDATVEALCNTAVTDTRESLLKTSHFTGTIVFTINAGDGRVTGSPYTITITSDTKSTLTKQVRVSDYGVIEIL